MGNKKFTEILLESFIDKDDFNCDEWLIVENMINDFTDNYFFNSLDEDEQYAMASLISKRMSLSIRNKEFKFTENSSSRQEGTNRTIKNYVFKYEITHEEVISLPKLIQTDITTREKQKSFYEDLNEVYESNKFKYPWAYTMYPQRDKTDEFIDGFLGKSFLDYVPIVEREDIIIYIIRFAVGYYGGKDYVPIDKRKPSTATKRDLEKIQKFQDFIKQFLPEKNTKPYLKGTTSDGKNYLEDINNRLEVLKLDLKNKEFKIFSKLYYYGSEALTKNDLEDFLKTKAKKYNLACSEDIGIIRESLK